MENKTEACHCKFSEILMLLQAFMDKSTCFLPNSQATIFKGKYIYINFYGKYFLKERTEQNDA